MGQRHQVIVSTTEKGVDRKNYAFHNQWCYGSLPLCHVLQVVYFQNKADKYSRLGNGLNDHALKISAILGTNVKEGHYSYYMDTTEEHVKDNVCCLSGGDNNDGITVIVADSEKKKISYCFMNIGCGPFDDIEPDTPMNAFEYASSYYSTQDKEWTAYEINKKIKAIDSKAHLLTMKELIEIFPEYYKNHNSEMLKIETCPKEDLPLYLNTEFRNVKRVLERRMKHV